MTLTDRIPAWINRLVFRHRQPAVSFTDLFTRFQQILEDNNKAMEVIADMGDKLSGQYVFDSHYLEERVAVLEKIVLRSAYNFNFITENRHSEIYSRIETMARQLKMELSGQLVIPSGCTVLPLQEVREVMDEVVGNKVFNLFRVMNLPRVNVPASFVVSIRGFRKFMAFNNLYDKIEGPLKALEQGENADAVANRIQLKILNGDIPSDLRKEILKAAEAVHAKHPESRLYSVRSSAVGEDGALSFAGLHDSFLNVPFRDLLSSYKEVVASLYNAESLTYRRSKNIPLTDMNMAVLYQEMIQGRVSGVVYTVDPNFPMGKACIIGATWGLGTRVVQGDAAVDTYTVSRIPPYEIIDTRINEKETEGLPDEDGNLGSQPCLTPEQASAIVETALIIERYFKRPMDIEWCYTPDGRLMILQARPLGLHKEGQARSPELTALLKKQKVLIKDEGIIAYRGIGAGPVWVVDEMGDLSKFPTGSVLVARYGIPLLAKALPRASAVITDVGSPTGHMATVAREFGIPTIVDAKEATQVLTTGQKVTVDADRNVVYQGLVKELLHHHLIERPLFEARYEFQILRRLLRRIAPLTLVDPEDTNFAVKNCQTFHDAIRFIHEKSLGALLKIASKPSMLLARGGKRLKSDLPLNMILIDIGGGLDDTVGKGGQVLPEQISSQPMKALWRGLSSENIWERNPAAADFKGIMSGVTRTQAVSLTGTTLAGLNIAILGSHYMNLTLRVGYHFTVVDALVGSSPEKNSIFFRFVGGATDLSRRSRRATLIASIMEKIGFKVEANGDLVIARAANATAEQIKNCLYLTGRLIGFVRQLDVLMKEDSSVNFYFERFMAANTTALTGEPTHKESLK